MKEKERCMENFPDSIIANNIYDEVDRENQIFIKNEHIYLESCVTDNLEEDTLKNHNEAYPKQELECNSIYTTENSVQAAEMPNYNQGSDAAATNEALYKFQCEYCLKRFRFFSRWKRHTASHEKPKVSRVPIMDLSTLVVEEHAPGGGRFAVGNNANFKEDEAKKCPPRRKDLMCDLCGKCFTQKNNLHRHKLVHLGTKPFQCDDCGFRFTEKSALDRHQVVHLGGGDLFKCAECNKAFNRKSNLERHALIHLGRRRHPCLTCGKIFTQRAHLRRHEETHTGIKDLECEECGKKFNRRGNLNVHVLLHKGIKPFNCEICGRMFSQKVNLKMHLKMQHNQFDANS